MGKKITDEKLNVEMSINGVNKTQAEISKIQTSIRGLKNEQEDLTAAKRKLIAEGKRESQTYKDLTAQQGKNRVAIDGYTKDQKKLQSQLGLTGLTMNQLKKRKASLTAQMNSGNDFSPEWKKLNAELHETDNRIKKVRGEMNQTGGVMARMKKSLGGFGSLLLGGAGIMAAWRGVKKLVNVNSELSDSQANVRKTTGLSDEAVAKLTKTLKKLDTRTPILELEALAEEAGRLGKRSVKDIEGFVRTADKISVALGDDLQGDITENVRLIGKLTEQYRVGDKYGGDFEKTMERMGSAVNEVAASGSNQAGFLVDYLSRLSGVSNQTHISADEQLGYAAALDESAQSVEVSGTTMGKVIVDMYKNADEYAQIAGVSTTEFSNLLKTDANEALLIFLEGLKGNNEGFEVMTKKMEGLKLESNRSIAVLTSLAANTDKVRAKQEIANKAIIEATSLTEEFNIKNNNLAGNLEKIGNAFSNYFKNSAFTGWLTGVTAGFLELIGVTKDVNETFREETKTKVESAAANRKLVDTSSALLREYESLTKDGVEPTKEAKERLDVITLQLKDHLGDSVVALNKETGALTLNTDAVKKQIEIKRLASDAEASELVSRLKGAKDNKAKFESELPALIKTAKTRKLIAAEAIRQLKESEDFKNKSRRGQLGALSSLDAVQQEREATKALNVLKGKINEREKRRLNILTALKKLDYSENVVKSLFPDKPVVEDNPDSTELTQEQKDAIATAAEKRRTDAAASAKREKEQYKNKEEQLSEIIRNKINAREIDKKDGLERNLANIDENYRKEIEKAEGHADKIKELEFLRDQEKADLKLEKQQEYSDRITALEEEDRKLKDDAELEREIAAAGTQIQKDELKLEHARSLALGELDILMEAELAKVEAVENAEQLKAAIRENYSLQAGKLNTEFDNQEKNLKKDQVKWTEMTEEQKLNAVTGALGAAATAFNEGSGAWKAVKISETLITTYQSAQNAFNALAGIPIVGPALGTAAAGLAVVAGLQQVAKIKNTPIATVPQPRTTRGFEDGFYSDVTRTDGKRFNARNMGRSGTQIVNEPSYFSNNGGFLTGEGGPEMIIDTNVFRRLDPKIINNIMEVRHNVKGFESGSYPNQTGGSSDPELKAMLATLINRFSEPIMAKMVYGYDDENARQVLQNEITASKNNGKLTQ